MFRDLWPHIRDGLPKKSRSDFDYEGEPPLPPALESALRQLYANYEQRFQAWETDEAAQAAGLTPPVFIVVCNNTAVSKMVYDFISGWEQPGPAGEPLP